MNRLNTTKIVHDIGKKRHEYFPETRISNSSHIVRRIFNNFFLAGPLPAPHSGSSHSKTPEMKFLTKTTNGRIYAKRNYVHKMCVKHSSFQHK